MRYLFILTTLFFLHIKSNAQNKIRYGIGVDLFQTKLKNADRETFSGYGHSFPGFKQNDQLGYGLTLLANKSILKNFTLETGIGIANFRSKFHFNYIHPVSNEMIDNRLTISLYYVKTPLLVTFNLPLNTKSIVNFSIGADMRFLFMGKDNYQEIIFENILLPKSRYNLFIPSFKAVLGYTLNLNENNKIRFEAFGGQDLKSTIGKERGWWGFYKNLSNVSYQYYGLSIKYFSPNK